MYNWKTKTDEQITKIITANQGRMEDRRRNYEDLWAMVISIFRPRRYDILRKETDRGRQYGAELYDQGPSNSLHKFVSGKLGYMVNRSVPWIQFVSSDAKFMRQDDIKGYLQDFAEQILFSARRSTLYSTLVPHTMDADSIGTSVVIPMEDEVKDRIVYDVVHPKDSYIGVDKFGDPKIYHRTLSLTRMTAQEMFGRDVLPKQWFKKSELKNPFAEDDYLWTIYPNEDRDNTSALSTDQPWLVLCVLRGARGRNKSTLVYKKGRKRFVICNRSGRESGSEYGTSVAADCLTAGLMLNKLGEKSVDAAHKAVDPAKIASASLRGRLKTHAGGTSYVDNINQEGVKTWLDNSKWPITDAQIQRIQAQMDDRMFIRFFEMLSAGDIKARTAYEVSQMMSEKAVLMSTIIDTFEQESLEPCLAELMWYEEESGRLPDPPEELLVSGGTVDIRYLGPLSQLQRALLKGKGIVETQQIIMQMAELWPEVVVKFNALEMAEELADSQGMSRRLIKSDAEVDEILARQAQEAQQAQAMEMAEQAGKAAGGLGKAPEEGSPAEALMAGAV